MEMGRIPDDPYAGYVEDDSELEYSDEDRWENGGNILISARSL